MRKQGLLRYLAIAATLASLVMVDAGTSFAAPPLSVYGKLPGFERAALSPSGARIALIGTVNEQRVLIVVDQQNTLLTKMEIGPDIKVRSLAWAGDAMVLIERSNTVRLGFDFTTDKAELHSMTVVSLDGAKSWNVFAKNQQVQGGIRGFYGVNQRGGKWYGTFGGITLDSAGAGSNYLDSTKPVLYEVDLQTQGIRKIANRIEDPDDDRDWLVGPDGKVSAKLDTIASSGKWSIDTARKSHVASGVQKLGAVGLVGFGTTPETFIYAERDADGAARWYETPLAGGAATEILRDEDVSSSFFDHVTGQLIGYRLGGDVPAYKFFDPAKAKAVAATQKAFPGHAVHLMDWDDAFDRLLVMTEGDGDPQSWYVVDLKARKADPIGVSYTIAPADVAPTKVIKYKAADGTEIAGVLTLPPGRAARNLPIVVFPHGGPTARDYPGFDWWAQAFASRGYAVFQPNFRGSSGYGPAFERAGHGQWGRAMQTDISDGLAQLAKDGVVDARRACIMGASYGGYAALAGVTLQQGLYRCAVSVAGIGNVAKMVQTDLTASGDNAMMRRGLKDEVGMGHDLNQVSPIRFAARADAPILLMHGKDDTVVLYDQSASMAAALTRAGKPVEFVTLPQTDHWLTRGETRLAMLNAAVAFVEKHNPPDAAR
jgi:dipeptidyl aminopeptidase/acylaminoacyl peptidase